MYGAIIGDIVGSAYEFRNIKTKTFPLFSPGCDYTDDSLMTIAVAQALIQPRKDLEDFKSHLIIKNNFRDHRKSINNIN